MAQDMDKPPTLNARAAEIGTSVVTLRSWQRCGVDVFSADDVRRHLRTARNLPENLKPGFRPPSHDADLVVDVDKIDIDQLKLDMINAPDKHTAQTIEIKIRGLLSSTKLAQAQGELISRNSVEEEMTRVGSVFKAAVKRLEADLPPMIHGASPETMQKLIGEKADEVLRAMKDEYKKIDEIGRDE